MMMIVSVYYQDVYASGSADMENRLRKLEEQLNAYIKEEFHQLDGLQGFNSQRKSFSLRSFKKRKNLNKELLSEINKINPTLLASESRIDFKILRHFVKTIVKGHKWVMFGAINPLNYLEGLHMLMVDLEHVPFQIYEVISLMRRAIRLKRTNYISSMRSFTDKLLEHVMYRTTFFTLPGNDLVPVAYKDTALTRQLKMSQEAYEELRTFLKHEYIPATRKQPGVGSMKNGIGYYKACLRFHTTLPISPDEAHAIGVQEVARIANEILMIMTSLNFKTDLRTFIRHVEEHTAISNDQQVQRIEEILQQVNEDVLEKVFYRFERPQIQLVTIDSGKDLSLASYGQNVFYINTNSKINRSSLITMPLVLHEANPGHHLQHSYMNWNHLPKYRRDIVPMGQNSIPFRYPTYTAFIEGWALYAEHLGKDLGLYPSIYDELGRLLSEMLRACRLVVDTGIHAFGWTREQSVEYMLNYTGSDIQTLENEVDMAITWPGRSSAYKIGELKIKELRQKASKKLGNRFNIREFHDVILHRGPVPLSILDDIVNDWVKSNRASNGIWTLSYCQFTLYIPLLILFF